MKKMQSFKIYWFIASFLESYVSYFLISQNLNFQIVI